MENPRGFFPVNSPTLKGNSGNENRNCEDLRKSWEENACRVRSPLALTVT
jgi:hypothetical protein